MRLSPRRLCASLVLGLPVIGTGALVQNQDAPAPGITVTLLGSGGARTPTRSVSDRAFSSRPVVFARVRPRVAVYSHISDADLITPARKSYSDPLETGEDLMVIGISDTVTVRRGNR